MRASNVLFSLSAFAAAVSASAIPQQQEGKLAKRQTEIDTATIPTFSFGPSSTVYLGGGSAANATSSKQPASDIPTSRTQPASETATSSQPASGTATSPVDDSKSSSTAAGTVIATATGNIPTFSFFPSSTVPVNGSPTSAPGAGTGSDNQNGNGAGNKGGNKGGDDSGNKAGNGTTDGTDNGAGNDGDNGLRQNLADLLQGLLDLLGN
ncbi:hypothetical protein F5B21DRAFT_506902 [Xylaria acuta]|nr:hypothetical protein F5B21DRAFT_506902 [Xylaria acuta]